jgi:hypothetical protein
LSGNTPETFTDEDLVFLVEKQRLFMDSRLLEQNPLEQHVEGYREKIKYLEDEEFRITSIRAETPIFSDDARRCQITARQFWSKNFNITLVYTMTRDSEGRWKILGWYANTDEIGETDE